MTVVSRRIAMPERWTLEEFLLWEEKQPEKYELVDGRPRLMTGGSQAHDTIKTNVIALLHAGLRGKPCRPAGGDLRVPVPATGNCRYPDAAVDCGEFRPKDHDASEPTIVFEVLSKSNTPRDQMLRTRDYDSIKSICCYVVILQTTPCVTVLERDESDRLTPIAEYTSLEDNFTLPVVDIELRLSDIYDRLTFETED